MVPFLEKQGLTRFMSRQVNMSRRIGTSVGPYYVPKTAFAGYAYEVKKSVHIPVGVINRINDPILADQLFGTRESGYDMDDATISG